MVIDWNDPSGDATTSKSEPQYQQINTKAHDSRLKIMKDAIVEMITQLNS